MKYEEILLAHGSGGRLTSDLIECKFLPYLGNTYLEVLGDSAVFDLGGKRLCFTTDSYVINPVFFPEGISALSRYTGQSMTSPFPEASLCS